MLTRSLAHRVVLALLALLLVPAAAVAAPAYYEFESGSAIVRGSLAGDTESIFVSDTDLEVDLTGVSAVFDDEVGDYGRLESLSLTSESFTAALDTTLVGLESVTVMSPTIHSLSGSDLNLFGQFALQTEANALVSGTLAGGGDFGPVPVTSLTDTSSATGIVQVSGDQIIIQVIGVTVASFDQMANPDPDAPDVEIKMDFTFVGTRVANPIPEPSAALVFAMGLVVVGSAFRRRRD